jgi:hypothetical protein
MLVCLSDSSLEYSKTGQDRTAVYRDRLNRHSAAGIARTPTRKTAAGAVGKVGRDKEKTVDCPASDAGKTTRIGLQTLRIPLEPKKDFKGRRN